MLQDLRATQYWPLWIRLALMGVALGGWAVAAYLFFSLSGRFTPFGATAAILATATACLPAAALAAFELAFSLATWFEARSDRKESQGITRNHKES